MLLDKYIKVHFADASGVGVEIETPALSGVILEIPFRVDRSNKRDPDKAEVTVYNLNEVVRSKLGLDAVQMELYAGLTPNPPLIFKGEITDATNEKSDDFTDWVTRVYAEDTKSLLRTQIISRSYAAGTPYAVIFNDLASAGQLQPDVSAPGKTPYPFAVLLPVRDAIQFACERFGCRQQIIDQRLVIRVGDAPVSETEIPLISPDTGLIGIPASDLEDKRIRRVNAVSILNEKLVAGGKCMIKTAATTGSRKAPIRSGAIYSIDRVVHINGEGEGMTTEVVTREFTG